jgi:hypothetical protein
MRQKILMTKNDRSFFSQGHFEIIVIQNQKLLFFNSFDYETPEDYVLFTAEC